MKSAALMLMAKQPIAGKSKTRLCPPLSAKQAADLAEALLRDSIALGSNLKDVQLAIAVSPLNAREYFRTISPPDTLLFPVEGANIGEVLNKSLNHLFANGHSKALAFNADGPSLPAAYLEEAVDLLDGADVVLGPNEDGGYYLIGYKQPHPYLYEDITWSTASVLSATLRRAEAHGLRVAQLPLWYDIDSLKDLERLRLELQRLPEKTLIHSRAFLADYTPNGSS